MKNQKFIFWLLTALFSTFLGTGSKFLYDISRTLQQLDTRFAVLNTKLTSQIEETSKQRVKIEDHSVKIIEIDTRVKALEK